MISTEVTQEILAELNDEQFVGKTHGTRSGAKAGCKGPMCLKFTRDRVRESYRRNNPTATRLRGPANPELDRFLEQVIEAHAQQRQLTRAS